MPLAPPEPEEDYGLDDDIFDTKNPFDDGFGDGDIKKEAELDDVSLSSDKDDKKNKKKKVKNQKKEKNESNPFDDESDDDIGLFDDDENGTQSESSKDEKQKRTKEVHARKKNEKNTNPFNEDEEDIDDDEEGDDEEDEEEILTRNEERAKLLEMSELAVSSTQTMEYDDNESDDDFFSASNASEEEKTVRSQASKKMSKMFKKGSKLSKTAGQVYQEDSYMKMDPYFGLDENDESDNEEGSGTSQRATPSKFGPCVTKYKKAISGSFFFSLMLISGLSYFMIHLKNKNQILVEEIYRKKDEKGSLHNVTLKLSLMPSLSPIINDPLNGTIEEKTDDGDSSAINIVFKVNTSKTSDVINSSSTLTSETTINKPGPNIINTIEEISFNNTWQLPLSVCANKNETFNYSMISCLDSSISNGEKTAVRGASMSLSSDGRMVAVGVQKDVFILPSNDSLVDNDTMPGSPGVVQVFYYGENEKKSDGEWEQKWTIPNTNSSDSFGSRITLSGDGTRIAVATPTFNQNSGRIEIYELSSSNDTSKNETNLENRNDMEWILMEIENPFGVRSGDQEGYSIDLSDDGTHLAVGAIGFVREQELQSNSGSKYGRVRVLEYSKGLNKWLQKGSDLMGQSSGDQFGAAVSLSGDGLRLAVAGWNEEDIEANVAVFEFQPEDWVEIMNSDVDSTILGGSSPLSNDNEPCQPSVSLSMNGNILALSLSPVISEDQTNQTESLTKIFEYIDEMQAWSQLGSNLKTTLVADDSPIFNKAILSGDGKRVMILTKSGSLDEFKWDGISSWEHASNVGRGDYFSSESFPVALALSGHGSHLGVSIVQIDEQRSQNVISVVYNILS